MPAAIEGYHPLRSRKPRVLIFVVAYEAESTLGKVLDRIPESVFRHHQTEVLVIDDSSRDKTFEKGLDSSRASRHRITVLYNARNQGYGGNQKLGYQYAIRHGYDYIVLLHGDGQYAPESIPTLLEPLLDGSADAVLGSRMLIPGAARKGGMPAYKFVGNRILTFLQNRLLRSNLSEFHSGFRAYRVSVLRQIPFQYNANIFHFDTEIIIQLMRGGFRIAEVPIPTYHGGEIHRTNGLRYAKDVIVSTLVSRLQNVSVFYCRKFDVLGAGNKHYGLKLGYRSSHTMALDAIPPAARVLDIGCGPGSCAEELARKGCVVSGMDQFPPEKAHAFKDFFLWDETKPFPAINLRAYDYVLLLDIIEHLTQPEAFLAWLRQAARSFDGRPTFIVTTGNIVFFIVRLQSLLGNFNYGKRGILDLTHSRLYTFASLQSLFEQCGFRVERLQGVPAPWPKALGLNVFTRLLVRVNDLLIRLSRGFFAYQIYLVARPTPTVDALLDDSIEGSNRRAATLSPVSRQRFAPCYDDSLAAIDQPTSSVP
jgi:glycosyltransferase involved in cell wall biosynthesis